MVSYESFNSITINPNLHTHTTKCMSKPSLKALGAAHHLLHYAEVNKDRGIKFNSHGNLEPICYLDSGFKQAKMGSKPQYWLKMGPAGPCPPKT
eukprot:COSAG05_NODE_4_length_49189_cov_157.128784_34_plen_94_part_00